jgi:flagellar protein FlaI
MAVIVLPFTTEMEPEAEVSRASLYDSMSPELKKVSEDNPHLLEYLSLLPISEIGMPQYHPELSRKLGETKEPNIIYPTERAGVFIHILFSKEKDRNHYIPVEPIVSQNLDQLMLETEVKLLDLGNKLLRLDPNQDKEKQLLDYLDQVVTLDDSPEPGLIDKQLGLLRKNGRKISKIKLTPRQLEGIKYLFVRDKVGVGILDALIADPYIEDISCSGLGHIFIEHKIFKSLESTITFATHEELDEFVLWLAERIKKPVTPKQPITDATLPDGSRINIVYGSDVSKQGSNFSIRKFSDVPLSVFELVEFGALSYQMLAYLSLVIGNGMNLFVSGETASGKTTLLNAVTTFIPPLAKIITIEDTPELQVPHKNWIREVVQSTKTEEPGGAVTMFDLLKAALRQRPNEIMVGEIRGTEGNIAFQAMQTGHSVMATFHAATTEKLIQRLTGDPILVPKNWVENLNVVVLTSQVKLPSGKKGRRITGIAEIVGYEPMLDSFSIVDAFKWIPEKDIFEFTGYMASYILEYRIAPRLGFPSHKKQRIYGEIERRTNIFTKLHKEKGVTGFYEVLEVLNQAQREGLL